MDNKRKPLNQRVKIVESSGITKKTKTDVQDNKNVTEPKDHKPVIEPKKSWTVEPKDKKTVTIVKDAKDKKIITDTKEKKMVTIMIDPKDWKPVEVKNKRTVTFVTDVNDKKIVIEPKEKTIVPILIELKEKKIVADIKERVILPVVTEIKEKKPVIETKEKVPVPEVKEKKSAVTVKEKKRVVEKKEETHILAQTVVDNAVASAIRFVEDAKNPVKNIKWLTHGEFTAEKGQKQIEYFVSTWEFQKCWPYYADFIEKKDLLHSFHYLYRVRWSVPTAVRPMPRVSANAYFTIKFNKNKPLEMPVEVSYIFENSELLQRPGKIRFREQWLRDITETKHILLESIPFKVV